MRFVVRTDLGGRIAALPALEALAGQELEQPFILLQGGNGSGKSTLLQALRTATGLVGDGIGAFSSDRHGGWDDPLPLPRSWERKDGDDASPDYARHQLLVQDRRSSDRGSARLAEGAVGVLDPVQLGWQGQRTWLHDGRALDNTGEDRYSMEMGSMRRSADDALRSHGQMMTGRLRYAVAWALGMFDLADPYDKPAPEGRNSWERDRYDVRREIFHKLSGHPVADKARTRERWLLLDEPETGLDAMVFARFAALLASHARPGRLRVVCATHSLLADDLARLPNVQRIDLDGYAPRLQSARAMLALPALRKAAAADEMALLRQDCAVAISTDRGLRGQGQFTAHDALSIPYESAVIPPYGKQELAGNMRCSEAAEEASGPRRR